MNTSMTTFDQNLTMSSREIADLVQSRHDNVKISIKTLALKGLISFTETKENPTTQGGRPATVYNVNKRDSYVVVAQLSPEFTAALVDRWQELEENNSFQIPQSLPEALQLAADLAKKNEEAEKQLAIAAPKVDFADRVAGVNKGIQIGNFAKAVGLGPRRIFQVLRNLNILMSGGCRHNLPFQKYIDLGYFQVRQGTYEARGEQRISHTPLITGKGEQWLTHKLVECGELSDLSIAS
ncbi:phage antirepressor KilAC domain-containing protein [Vibrio quintilis]|uniref:Phage antirepressor protein KilAC domain protein n=1 Tax=Vibrio quintilis TaxID=1117707 RepID=A0A1M7YP32_9VIBR|nr:phage antirepressor KilAC domain-containing protein [Vibrio quintilis]SHO54377.1 Phage antirepressor protein KilAC domain protein [Vibrio quintilis]